MATKRDLIELKIDLGGNVDKVRCTQEEIIIYRECIKKRQPLPEDVFEASPYEEFQTFYKTKKTDLTHEELLEYLQYRKLETLISIKRCLVFFVVLTIISMIIGYIAAFNIF